MKAQDFYEKHAPHLAGMTIGNTCGNAGEKHRWRFNGDQMVICLKCGCGRTRKRPDEPDVYEMFGVSID